MKARLFSTFLKFCFAILTLTVFLLPNISQGQETTNLNNSPTHRVFLNPSGLATVPMNVNDLPDDPQHPMYGLNLYIPAWDEDYETNLDWYGSGDIDGNDTINMADYNSTVTGTDPFNDGTHRGDTDMDGDSGDADDKAIIMNYINGNITHINRWELESESQKTSHLENALAIDPTSEVNANSSGWFCSQYMNQTFTNFNGIYDINNSGFANDNGTNVQYDLTHNGIFRIPLRKVDTQTGSGIGHNINNVYLGSPENQDATEFEDRIYIEPQTDVIQEPGDYSLNDYANEGWYGYYNNPVWGWRYENRNLVNYDLDVTPIVGTNIHPDLVESWTPFDQVTYPEDQNYEFPGDTSVSVNGEPGNLYTGTVYSYSDVSTQTNDSTCTDVTYTVTRSWEGVAGAYDSSNTSEAAHDQIIDVEDTTPPTADFPEGTEIEYYVGIENDLNPSLFGGPTNIQDNSALPVDSTMMENSTQVDDGSCQQVNFVYSHNWDVNDVCSNNLSHSIEAYVSDNTAPVRDGNGNWTDNSGLEVLVTTDTTSTQDLDPNSCEHYTYNYTVTETGSDVCGNYLEFEHETETVENELPYRIAGTPVPNQDTIHVYEGESIDPDSTGWAEWVDPESGPITRESSDELVEEDAIHRLWYRTQTGADPCGTSADTAYHYIYEFKPTGIAQEITQAILQIYPNPTSGNFTVYYTKSGTVKIGIYNLHGRLLEEIIYQNSPKAANIKMSITSQPKGIYLLKIVGEDGSAETVRIVKR